jgi:hypothetical protein
MTSGSQVRFVEYGKNPLSGSFGQSAAVTECGVFGEDGVKHIDSEITVARQDAARR